MARYKIIQDSKGFYEAKVWRWWWPFWVDVEWITVYIYYNSAQKAIYNHKRKSKTVFQSRLK